MSGVTRRGTAAMATRTTGGWRGVGAACAVVCMAWAGSARAAVTLAGGTADTERVAFVLGASGLPTQIVIRAAVEDLPLEYRGVKAPAAPAGILAAAGRGPQLRGALRVEVRGEGGAVAATVAQPAVPAVDADGTVRCASRLRAGAVEATLGVRYAAPARLDVELELAGNGATVDGVDIVLDLAGAVDCVVVGPPVDETLRRYAAAEFALALGQGVVWANVPVPDGAGGAAEVGAARRVPGVPGQAFVGSGDRGFTFRCTEPGVWPVATNRPTMTIERVADGACTWRIHAVNQRTTLAKPALMRFSLRVHPATQRAAGARRLAWLDWPYAGQATARPTADGGGATGRVVRADVAGLADGCAAALLEGSAGGDALSRADTLAMTYPPALFRFLAATHVGVAARLKPNGAALAQPGMHTGVDRMALARALLNDAGVDALGLAHVTEALRTVRALEAFGLFAADGMTECFPWWRNGAAIRYGEARAEADAFATDEANAAEHTAVTVYRRPGPGGKGVAVLFVVANEGPRPTRERLYVLDPARVLGGANTLSAKDAAARWDFASVPADSDWNQARATGALMTHGGDANKDMVALVDAEDSGFVRRDYVGERGEIYGPLFVPAFGFRLLLGVGVPAAK